MKEIINSLLFLLFASLLSLSCSSDDKINAGDVAPVYLDLVKNEKVAIPALGKLSGVGVFYQRYGSNDMYVLNERSGTIFRVDVKNKKIDVFKQIPIENAEYFSLNEDENCVAVVANGEYSKNCVKFSNHINLNT